MRHGFRPALDAGVEVVQRLDQVAGAFFFTGGFPEPERRVGGVGQGGEHGRRGVDHRLFARGFSCREHELAVVPAGGLGLGLVIHDDALGGLREAAGDAGGLGFTPRGLREAEPRRGLGRARGLRTRGGPGVLPRNRH